MQKSIKKSTLSEKSIASCSYLALLWLCPLMITSCGENLTPKPNVFDMTRLNQNGNMNDGSDYMKNPWDCVRDNKSGLVWEVKKTESGLQNINNTYSWYDSDKTTNGGWAGKVNSGTCTGSNCDTESYIKAINVKKLCGLSDWYLPSRYELNTIVDISIPYPGPTFPRSFFQESLAGKYWTDTTFRTRRGSAWIWSFDFGSDTVVEKSEAHSVRLTHVAPKKPTAKEIQK